MVCKTPVFKILSPFRDLNLEGWRFDFQLEMEALNVIDQTFLNQNFLLFFTEQVKMGKRLTPMYITRVESMLSAPVLKPVQICTAHFGYTRNAWETVVNPEMSEKG